MPNAVNDIETKYRLDTGDVAQLLGTGPAWRLSLLLPLEKSSHEAKVGAVQLRDLRRAAEAEMDRRLIGPLERAGLLAPIDALLNAPPAHVYHGEGLAIYVTVGFSKTVILAQAPAPSVEIDRHFRLDPLLQGMAGKDRFYLLCLSLHSIQLWEGDGVSMKPISLEDLETNIKDALHFEDSDTQVQFHSNSGSPSRNNSKGQGSTFFGVGGENHDRKREFLSFFRIIDKGIAVKLAEKQVPLILAGVGYLMPIFREANTYGQLAPYQIPGATHAAGPVGELHAKASALLREDRQREMLKALSEYRENLTTARTVSGFTDVVPSACHKQLTHLFIRKGDRQWGIFNPADGRTEVLGEYRQGAEDLVNLAAVKTLLGQGKVYVVEDGEMPEDSGIAGLCRT
jgi:release factor family 7